MSVVFRNVHIVGNNLQVATMFLKRPEYRLFSVTRDEKPDLVVWTGGADVNPKLYGEDVLQETFISDYRDREDIAAWEQWGDIPKVGICRGAQFLNVMSGGALWQDVTSHGRDHKILNLLHVPEILEGSLMVTSTHHQMMIPGPKGEVIAIAMENGQGLSKHYISGKARDKPRFDTEVMWYPESRSLCCQFHPEYKGLPGMEKYFFNLIDYLHFKE